MCSIARNKELITPMDYSERKKQKNESIKHSKYHRALLYGREFYDRNCNPAFSERHSAWYDSCANGLIDIHVVYTHIQDLGFLSHRFVILFRYGSKNDQIKWSQKNKIQFYETEIVAPVLNEIPFESFVVGTQFRHPIKRLYSLYKENMLSMCNAVSDVKCSISTSKINVSVEGPKITRKYAEYIAQFETPASKNSIAHRKLSDTLLLKSLNISQNNNLSSSDAINLKYLNVGTPKSKELKTQIIKNRHSKLSSFQSVLRLRNAKFNPSVLNMSESLHKSKRTRDKWKLSRRSWIEYLNAVQQNENIAFFASRLICKNNKKNIDECSMNKYFTETHAAYSLGILKRLSFLSILEGILFVPK